ncbi:hypothetical protein GCM10023085_27860 [Actinomadura viridis]
MFPIKREDIFCAFTSWPCPRRRTLAMGRSRGRTATLRKDQRDAGPPGQDTEPRIKAGTDLGAMRDASRMGTTVGPPGPNVGPGAQLARCKGPVRGGPQSPVVPARRPSAH